MAHNRINQRLELIKHSKNELWFLVKESIKLFFISCIVKFLLKSDLKFNWLNSNAVKAIDEIQNELDWFISPKCDDELCSCCNKS